VHTFFYYSTETYIGQNTTVVSGAKKAHTNCRTLKSIPGNLPQNVEAPTGGRWAFYKL